MLKRLAAVLAGLVLSVAHAADTPVSSLPAATALGGTELLYGVQGGASKKVTASQIRTFAIGSPGSSIVKGDGSGGLTTYGGTSCTNQFVRSISVAGVATCATVGTSDLAITAVTPGSYTNGSFTVGADGRLTAASSGSGSSLTATYCGYGSGSNTLTGTADCTYTTATGILAISKSLNDAVGIQVANGNGGNVAQAAISVGSASLTEFGAGYSGIGLRTAGGTELQAAAQLILSGGSGYDLIFTDGNSITGGTERFRIYDAKGVGIRSSGAGAYNLKIANTETLTADRTLTVKLNDASRTLELFGSTTVPVASQQLTFTGPTAARTITFPDASITVARTDAANTFTGHQTIESVTTTGATGTGKLVFDGSPALVTPDLGTPSALVCTNCSGTASSLTAGSATTLATARAIYGNNFDGSAALTQIIASTYGGTGNGFVKFSGPASSEKTFTLPNASATVLTDNAAVTVAQGGTGNASTTAYGTLFGGTTSTGAFQTVAACASGAALMGGGTSALPSCTGSPSFSGTVSDAIGDLRGLIQNSKSAAYTTVLSDCGKHIYHPTADTTARTWTIDSNANVAAPIGCTITFVNDLSAGTLTVAITSDTMRLAGTTNTGSRTLTGVCVATAIKVTSTVWIISGSGCLTMNDLPAANDDYFARVA